jgi:hypothetical protein
VLRWSRLQARRNLTALDSDGAGASQRAHRFRRGKALAMIAKHHQQFGGQQFPCTGQGVKYGPIRMLDKERLHCPHDLRLLLHQGEQQLCQEAGLVFISQDDSRIGLRYGTTQMSVQCRQAAGMGVALCAAKAGNWSILAASSAKPAGE